jgi:hypothetical protein
MKPENDWRLSAIEGEIEDFEERYDYFTSDQWIDWSLDWLNYLVIGVQDLYSRYDVLTDDQKGRFVSAIQKLRELKPKVKEIGYEYPEQIDQLKLPKK